MKIISNANKNEKINSFSKANKNVNCKNELLFLKKIKMKK
jgi:hypothetical protein